MRILVTGSRDWDDPLAVGEAMVEAARAPYVGPALRITLVSGACPTGADRIAEEYAEKWGWIIERHPADWATHGKAAGPIRNKEMVDLGADICLAFPKGESRGTRGCMALAEEAGIPVKNLGGE